MAASTSWHSPNVFSITPTHVGGVKAQDSATVASHILPTHLGVLMLTFQKSWGGFFTLFGLIFGFGVRIKKIF